MTSRKHDVMARRASSMDDHKSLSNDGQTAACGDDGAMVVRSAHSSPSRGHRKFTCLRKGGAIRGELDTISNELRRVGASLRGSLENLVNHCSFTFATSTATAKPLQIGHRTIKVELMCSGNQKSSHSSGGKTGALRRGAAASRGWSERAGEGLDDDDDDFAAGCDVPDHNFTSCLTLDAIVDGQFAARLDLGRIPRGDITIRVRNYRLEVIVERTGDGDVGGMTRRPDEAHRVTRPVYCGAVDVPIYVDTTTLRLQSVDDETTDALIITARMKGYVDSIRLSSSVSDVHRMSKSTEGANTGSDVTTAAVTSSHRGYMPVANHNWISLFRERAYTR